MSKEIVIIAVYLAILAYFLMSRKTHMLLPAAVAFGIGLIWTAVAGDIYDYSTYTTTILGVNLYALIAWSSGLLIVYYVFSLISKTRLRVAKGWRESALFNVLYIPLLIAVETIAYHGFNVVNVGTSSYPGLPLCDCLHAPVWMQIVYLMMGTIYFLVLRLCLKVKDSGDTPLATPLKNI